MLEILVALNIFLNKQKKKNAAWLQYLQGQEDRMSRPLQN